MVPYDKPRLFQVKLMFFKKATKFDEIFTVDLTFVVSVKSTVKILLIFVAFLENMNFISIRANPQLNVYI